MSDISSAKSASTSSFLAALWINWAIFGLEVAAFTLLRPRFPAVYEPRAHLPDSGKRTFPLARAILGWPFAVLRNDYSDVLRRSGMDAYFYLRFLRMMLKILVPIWFLSWAILLPDTAVNSGSGKSGLDQFTFGNVPTSQPARYAAHIILEWVFTFWIVYILRSELRHFTRTRHKYLSSPPYAGSPQSTVVLVTGIPKKCLTENALARIFASLPGGVRKVWLSRALGDLPALYDRRLAACTKLESAETELVRTALKIVANRGGQQRAGTNASDREAALSTEDVEAIVPVAKRPTHRLPLGFMPFALPLIGKKVDTIAWARAEIRDTTAALERGREALKREERRGWSEEARREASEPAGAIEGSLDKFSGLVGGLVKRRGAGKSDGVGDSAEEIVTDSGHAEDAEEEQMTDGRVYTPQNSAFIVFRTQLGAHLAAQVLSHGSPYRMSTDGKYLDVTPADVIWENLSLNPYAMRIRRVLSYAATAALIIFWALPVAFVGIISNIGKLCTTYRWLAWLCKIPHTVLGIIEGILPPVLLVVLMMLLPIILRLLAKFEGIPTSTGVERSLMTRYFLFQIVHSFLIVTLASGIIAALPQLVQNPTSIPTILATNLPQASNFFLTYVLLQGLSGTAAGFLQAVPLVLHYVKLLIFGGTPRAVYNIEYSLRTVEWGTLFPATTLIAVITIAYSIISPIINGLAAFTFLLFFFLYKYLFLFVLSPSSPSNPDSGGLFFPLAIQHVFTGLYIQQICLAALFFLTQDSNKKPIAIPEGVLSVVLIILTAGMHWTLDNGYKPLRNYLPLELAARASATYENPAATAAAHKSHVSPPAASTSTGNIAASSPERKAEEEQEDRFINASTPFDFSHPAATAPQRPVWLARDPCGLAEHEARASREEGVVVSLGQGGYGTLFVPRKSEEEQKDSKAGERVGVVGEDDPGMQRTEAVMDERGKVKLIEIV